jgi:hypothetical protein
MALFINSMKGNSTILTSVAVEKTWFFSFRSSALGEGIFSMRGDGASRIQNWPRGPWFLFLLPSQRQTDDHDIFAGRHVSVHVNDASNPDSRVERHSVHNHQGYKSPTTTRLRMDFSELTEEVRLIEQKKRQMSR